MSSPAEVRGRVERRVIAFLEVSNVIIFPPIQQIPEAVQEVLRLWKQGKMGTLMKSMNLIR